MGEMLDGTDYETWVSHLFPSDDYVSVVAVSAGAGIALFVLGYVISLAGPIDYFQPSVYLGPFAAFGMLAALGMADSVYADVWNEALHAFDVDEEAYCAVVCPRLDRIYDVRPVLGYAAVFAVPYLAIVVVSYLPAVPLYESVERVFYGGDLTYPRGISTVVLLSLFGVVNAMLIATIIHGFVSHLALVSAVSELRFRNVYRSASDLEPLAGFTMAGATAWLAGASLIILWMQEGIGSTFGTVLLFLVASVGIVFFVAPQLVLHDALADAKREEIVSVQAQYDDLYEQMAADADTPADPSLQLEVLDRRLENARSISTWVYDISSIGKLAAASVVPWLTLIQQLVSTVQSVPVP